jgi:RNA polymerase sigma-70 factor (ECF subfamily)
VGEISSKEYELTDLELIDEFLAGREGAFNELVSRYSGKVLTMCMYFLKDRDQAYDMSQEVFLKVYRSLGKFRRESRFSTWIHTIAVNTCKNKLTFWKRISLWRTKYEADPLITGVADEPEKEVFRNERQRLVREEIYNLPEKHREIILLKDIQSCSYDEIAQILGITQGTVKSRLHRAREALAVKLEQSLGKDFW